MKWAQGRLLTSLAGVGATLSASIVLIPLFDSFAFALPVLAAVVAVVAAGIICRLIDLPVVLHPIAEILALTTALAWIYALPETLWGFIPGPAAVSSLRELVQLGIDESQVLVAPVPGDPALTILAAGGVGLIAICVDIVGVTLRLPAIAGIALLALYALPAAIAREGVAWWLLPIAVAGWLALLASDTASLLRWWGRPLHARGAPSSPRGRPRGWLAAAAAITIALALPAVIPGLGNPVLGSGRGEAISGVGSSNSLNLDPFVSLRRSLVNNPSQEILQMRSDAARPGYLRLNTLTEFDGVRWSAAPSFPIPLTDSLPAPAVGRGVAVETNTYQIDVGALTNSALPVPYAATRIQGSGTDLSSQWTWDGATRTVVGDDVTSEGQSYAVLADQVTPTRAQLRRFTSDSPPAAIDTLTLPGDLSPLVADLARVVTAGASSSYEQAVALEQWFTETGDFVYSTSIIGDPDTDPVADFLTERVGYCEQFAAAMALMARSLGIPARVNVGFTSGTEIEPGVWSVQGSNAHAWPEMWFDQVGWVWFEPTPSTATTAGVVPPPYSNTPDRPRPTPEPSTAQPLPPDVVVDDPTASAATGPSSMAGNFIFIALVVAAASLAVPFWLTRLRRRRALATSDPRTRIDNAWSHLHQIASAWGWAWPESLTPRQAVATWTRALTDGTETRHDLARLLWWVEQARYAPADDRLDAVTSTTLAEVLRRVESTLSQRANFSQRVRARVWAPLAANGSTRWRDAWPEGDSPWQEDEVEMILVESRTQR